MNLMKISDLFNFEKGVLQSTKCTPGDYDFITASSKWKTHNDFTHEYEALVFAAAASGSLGRTHYVDGKFISRIYFQFNYWCRSIRITKIQFRAIYYPSSSTHRAKTHSSQIR